MIKATDNIYYVGVQDKDLRVFDIIMHSDFGTSYNSYIVKGAKKTVLFETVKDKFYDEFLNNIEEVCPPSEIDYIVVSHTEPDHTGSLARLLEVAPNATVLCSASAKMFLGEIVNHDFPVQVVTEKDRIDLGGRTLEFFIVPLLHWPDSMYTFIPELKALFTCDSFGCHYADDRVFNDLIPGDFTDAYKYYFDMIMGPFVHPFLTNALKKIAALDIEFIGNGHGPVLRTDIKKYITMYEEWSAPKVRTKKTVPVVYVSAYGYTKQLAETIALTLLDNGIDEAPLFDLVVDDKEAAQQAILDSSGFLLGSPTIVGDALPPIYEMLLPLNPIIHKGLPAGAFGSFGWSGEGVPNLMARMEQLKLKLPVEGLRIRFKPSDAQLEQARTFAKEFANTIK